MTVRLIDLRYLTRPRQQIRYLVARNEVAGARMPLLRRAGPAGRQMNPTACPHQRHILIDRGIVQFRPIVRADAFSHNVLRTWGLTRVGHERRRSNRDETDPLIGSGQPDRATVDAPAELVLRERRQMWWTSATLGRSVLPMRRVV